MPSLLQILAALTPAQKRKVNEWEQPHHSFSDHVFGDPETSRITVPLESVEKDVKHPSKIKKHLEDNGFQIHNYKMGIAIDPHGRQVKIGKALAKTKAPDAIKKLFDNDPNRAASTNKDNNLRVTFSRHPHDVAAMSTGQGWTSCMNLKDGIERHRVERDVKEGTHIAYLHHKNDTDLSRPIARMLLKPYTTPDKSHTILVPEAKPYGNGGNSFHNTVHKWANEHFSPNPDDDYKLHDGLYNDGIAPIKIGKKTKLIKEYPTLVAEHGTDAHRTKLLNKFLPVHEENHRNASAIQILREVARHGNERHREKLLDADKGDGRFNNTIQSAIATNAKSPKLIDKMLDKNYHEHYGEAIARNASQQQLDRMVNDYPLAEQHNIERDISIAQKTKNPEHHKKIAEEGHYLTKLALSQRHPTLSKEVKDRLRQDAEKEDHWPIIDNLKNPKPKIRTYF